MTVNAIIQARCGSTRFPNKVFADINGKPLIWHVVNRLTYAETIDKIIVATTTNEKDDKIEAWCNENGIACFRGNETDVLDRYYSASLRFPSDVVVRITADDPFKEPSVIDAVVSKLVNEGYDHVTNNLPPTWPEGLDCEAFTFAALKKSQESANDPFEREHVTQYIYHNPDKFKIANYSSERDLSYLRWTIDNELDYEMVKVIYAHWDCQNGNILLLGDILNILNKYPEISEINSNIERSAMYKK